MVRGVRLTPILRRTLPTTPSLSLPSHKIHQNELPQRYRVRELGPAAQYGLTPPVRLVQPTGYASVMRARPTPTSAEAVRPVPALRGRSGRRAVVCRARRRGHPLTAGVPVSRSSALRRSGRRRAQVLLEHVSGQPAARDAAPSLGARVEAHHDTGVEPSERRRAREGLGPHGDDRRGVGEGVSAALRFLSESRRRAERDG